MYKGKTVCITGCTRGLGRAMVEVFAREGWIVAGCGRTRAALDELKARHGSPNRFERVDMASDDEVQSFCALVAGDLGVPHLLVNNAALINANAPLWEVEAQEFSRVIDVNIKGVASMIRHLVPCMIGEGRGVIVNFSSGWGRSTSPEVAPYCATKWAIEGLTRALAQELPDGLAAIALNPGIIDTEMLRSCFGPAAGTYETPQQWAEKAVPFLATLGPRDNGKALTAP